MGVRILAVQIVPPGGTIGHLTVFFPLSSAEKFSSTYGKRKRAFKHLAFSSGATEDGSGANQQARTCTATSRRRWRGACIWLGSAVEG